MAIFNCYVSSPEGIIQNGTFWHIFEKLIRVNERLEFEVDQADLPSGYLT